MKEGRTLGFQLRFILSIMKVQLAALYLCSSSGSFRLTVLCVFACLTFVYMIDGNVED